MSSNNEEKKSSPTPKKSNKKKKLSKGSSSVDNIIETIKNGLSPTEYDILTICGLCSEILSEESNLQPITPPVTIVGDIHGQLYDLLNLFKISGDLHNSNRKYVFLGDYVDRGYFSIETISLLISYKIKYSNKITLMRGNHESRQISQVFGLYEEGLRKYGSTNVWRYLTDLFDLFPLSSIINNNILCIHGGLSPYINTLDQINLIDRKQEIPNQGSMCDLMWSDPDDIDTWGVSSRGAGWLFGKKVVEKFNKLNNIDLICRAHQLVMEGYKYMFNQNLVTVWSAPNYCYRCGNDATVLNIKENGDIGEFVQIFVSNVDMKERTNKSYDASVPDYFL